MKVDLGEIPCSGYASQQFDFPALYADTLSQATRDLLEPIIESAVAAEAFPDANRFCLVIIAGHSDRVDTPGLSSEQRRAQELQASTLRAESAQQWFFNEVFRRLQAQGLTAPVDLSSMRNVDLWTVSCGSADLIHLTPGNDESKRRDNRRVHVMGTIFQPD
jgi:hypothetical protein